jgi:hypothetical protein
MSGPVSHQMGCALSPRNEKIIQMGLTVIKNDME